MITQFLNFDESMNLIDEFFIIDSDENTIFEQQLRDQEKFKALLKNL